jgi:hypothetical protein
MTGAERIFLTDPDARLARVHEAVEATRALAEVEIARETPDEVEPFEPKVVAATGRIHVRPRQASSE